MAEMAAAIAAMDFAESHAVATVDRGGDGAFDGIVEAWPAGAAVGFEARFEQRLFATGANENAGPFFVVEGAASRRLGAMAEGLEDQRL
jgi:hypothetical protein